MPQQQAPVQWACASTRWSTVSPAPSARYPHALTPLPGAASFGACCFTNGSFLAGQLIGYYDLLQATAKPIYSAHRVLLGKPVNDPSTSKETFINAHQLHAGLLVTQCPMLGTVAHIKRMVVEQRISRWLQIFNPTNSSRDCHLLLNALLADSSVRTSAVLLNSTDRLQSIAVDICHADLMAGTEPVYLPFVSDSCSGRVHHLDYTAYLHWEDFAVPAPADEPALLALATTFAQAVHQGQTVAINCLSGRGRSGSFASIVLGSLPSSPARSHDELIDLIVSLRERRDGLVETPQQYRFVSRVLGLADSADSQTLSQSSSVMLQPLFKHSHAAAVLAVLCVFFLLLPLRYIAQKHPKL